MNKVYAIEQDYEGIMYAMGIFAIKELADKALADFIAENSRPGNWVFGSVLKVVELNFHA